MDHVTPDRCDRSVHKATMVQGSITSILSAKIFLGRRPSKL